MARFSGKVGYGFSVEKPAGSGIWTDDIIERTYRGDVIKRSRGLVQGEGVNQDITISNSISIVADPFAKLNFAKIKYVKWAGAVWTVSSVDVQQPRLILSLGGVYNGPSL